MDPDRPPHTASARIAHSTHHDKAYKTRDPNKPIILAEKIADSMKLKTSLLSEGAEVTAA
jgi:hypothetical protein